MTAVLLGQETPGSPEWHELRRGGIGASEIAAVVGLSPWVSAFQLWHRKRGNIPDQATSAAMDWGTRLEPLVRQWWQEQHQEFFAIETPGTYAHDDRTWQRVNPDGLVLKPVKSGAPELVALYEGKTASAFSAHEWGPSHSDKIPLGYRCQVLHSLDVFGLERAYCAVLIGGNDPREYVIDFNETDAAALREAGAAFWESLQTDDEPPVDASFETYQTVRELHPDIDGSDIAVNPALYARYIATKADADSATDAHRQAKSELLKAMGDARRALVNDTPVLRRQPGRGGSVSLYPVKESA